MTALRELQEGRPREAFVELVGRTIRAVAISRNFPPPDEHDQWDAAAVETATSAFFASSQTPRRLADLRLMCTSDNGLRKRLHTTVKNFLADIGRQTDVGRLVLRINDVLGSEPAFVRREQHWSLVGSESQTAAVNVDALVAAANTVVVEVPTAWTKASRRKSPEIDRPSVVRLARALLDRAGGSLRTATIAEVAACRLGIGQTPITIDSTAFDPPQPEGIDHDPTTSGFILRERAVEVMALLNDVERLAIGLARLSAADLGKLLGLSKSRAALIRTRAGEVIRAELCDEEDGQEVAEVLLSMAREWAEAWTGGRDATY